MLLPTLLATAALGQTAVKPTDRTGEIWAYADVRVSRQIDQWFKDGDYPRAVGLLRYQAAYAPNDYDVATNLGWLLESTERDDEALAVYAEYRRQNPNDPDNRLPEAMLYNSRKRYADVVATLEPALKGKPHPNVYRLLGRSYERLGRFDDAIRVWTLQLKRFPKDLATRANIRRVRAKMAAPAASK